MKTFIYEKCLVCFFSFFICGAFSKAIAYGIQIGGPNGTDARVANCLMDAMMQP